uniref:Protein transport protein Sec61 subunit gamma n=1 Tax=Rattus norvegicus TaxID=10116 RepID=Q6TXH8_RAT|nr:LRRGT00021 [Rattus norvegicus]|eukprot:NP_001041402.1 uncharacterized protein LOC499136 [Rattus norvegicus]
MAKVKKLQVTADAGEGVEKEEHTLHCWWDCKLVPPLWKSVWRFLRKLDIELPEDPAIPLLGIYPKDAPTYNKDTCSTMFIAALFIIARSWKEPRCPSTEEWIQEMWYIYTMEYYASIKNNDFMKFIGKWNELENIILKNHADLIKKLKERKKRKTRAPKLRVSTLSNRHSTNMDQVMQFVEPSRQFVKDSIRLVKRRTKPDRKEFQKIARATAIGFAIMGFIGFFVKLIPHPC